LHYSVILALILLKSKFSWQRGRDNGSGGLLDTGRQKDPGRSVKIRFTFSTPAFYQNCESQKPINL